MQNEEKNGLPILVFRDQEAFRRWMHEHADSTDGIWVKFAKKASGVVTLNYAEALDVSLCYGWIDGLVNRYDDAYYLQRFTPRRARSKWSTINVGHVARLIESGDMQPRGLAEVERAKADGRWDAAYASPRNIEVPDDLKAALAAAPAANAQFEALSKSNRYSILYAIHDAKRPETRQRRIAKFVEMLERGETPG